AGPIGANVSSVADWQEMKIRRVAKLVDDFKSRRFLAGNAIGVNRIHNRKFIPLTEFAHNSERVIEVSIDRDNLRTVRKSLNQFSSRNFPGGQNHAASNSCSRRV